ncbi:hypothetical protein WK99_08215 [Burkholderia ubonensis]|nr:hypothetical protein WK99_08215 [Burkholderia ubonensis]
MLAELAILLVMRNREVPAWYPVLLFMYPIFETCFSIYRKKFVRGMSPGIPDGEHVHMLVYKRLMRWAVGAKTAHDLTRRNSLTSQHLRLLCLVAVIPATLSGGIRCTCSRSSCCSRGPANYVWPYVSIVRFKAPRWMVARKGRRHNHRAACRLQQRSASQAHFCCRVPLGAGSGIQPFDAARTGTLCSTGATAD